MAEPLGAGVTVEPAGIARVMTGTADTTGCQPLFPATRLGTDDLIDLFCTPPCFPETEYDRRVFAGAEPFDVPFEGMILKGYVLGTGPAVLLSHGWGSRASHMATIARTVAKAGFRTVTFDQPAHGRSVKKDNVNRSNLPEFCRALCAVARETGPLHAVIGHSLGAAAAILSAGGSPVALEGGIVPARLVSVSSPSGLKSIIDGFCRMHGIPDRSEDLIEGIERKCGFPRAIYDAGPALRATGARIMIVHDRDDWVIPFDEALKLQEACSGARLVATEKSRHRDILVNRIMLRAVKDFLAD